MRFFYLTLFVLIQSSCGLFSKTDKETTVVPTLELVVFTSKGETGKLGDSSTSQFSYDFKLGKTEVTQEEFKTVLGYYPNNPAQQRNSFMPVTMVSWFEAILFCNALSKAKKLDSVYTYSSVGFDSDEHSIASMDGLSANYSRNGYRLPTEAEWEFAARNPKGYTYAWGNEPDTNQANLYSWYQGNSNDSLHPVCTRMELNGLCDMGGNVVEWVDGWFGSLPSDTVLDFVGALQPNSSQMRIVKGGSFRSSIGELKITKRSDVYGTYSNTRNGYIGFRVAQGAIQSAQFSQNGGLVESKGTPLRLSTSKAVVKDFLGTSNAKLALVNGTNDYLATIDFSLPNLLLREEPQLVPPRHPTISPNGKWMAYATRSEGQAGESEIYLRSFDGVATDANRATSGWIPRWYIDLNTNDTMLIFASEAESNRDSASWSRGNTSILHIKSGMASGESSTFSKMGAFHDGASADGRYLVTGFTDLRVQDRQTVTTFSLFRSPENGKTKDASFQACNASISQGTKPLIAFLDFGYSEKSSITGRSYASHEFAFLLDPATQKVVDTIRVPKPWTSWDHLEWSNHPNFLVATVTDDSEAHKAAYIIRVSDHAMLKVVEGDDVLMPYLWVSIESTENPSPDSLLVYHLPDNGIFIQSYAAKIIRFWETRNTTEIYALGSSRTLHGFDPSLISSGSAINLGVVGADMYTILDFWKSYLKRHAKAQKVLLLEISIDFMYFNLDANFQVYYANSIGRVYDSIHNFWGDGLPSNFDDLLLSSPQNPGTTFFQENGYLTRDGGSFGASPLDVNTGTGYLQHPDSWMASMDSLIAALQSMDSLGLQVIGVIYPQNPDYLSLDLFGRYGPELEKAEFVVNQLKSRTSNLHSFHLLDEHKFGRHDYTKEDAHDYDHLGIPGAIKLTKRIDSVLAVMRSQNGSTP